jgi:hypothetical protein
MKKVVVFSLLSIFVLSSLCHAGTIFVATAQNMRGAMYLGYGPTPQCASEKAMESCTRDSWIPCSCKIRCIRCEMVPDHPIAMVPQKVRPQYKTFQ